MTFLKKNKLFEKRADFLNYFLYFFDEKYDFYL